MLARELNTHCCNQLLNTSRLGKGQLQFPKPTAPVAAAGRCSPNKPKWNRHKTMFPSPRGRQRVPRHFRKLVPLQRQDVNLEVHGFFPDLGYRSEQSIQEL